MNLCNKISNPHQRQYMSNSLHGCSQFHIHITRRELQENTGEGWRKLPENIRDDLAHHSQQHPGTGFVDKDTDPHSVAIPGGHESFDTQRYDLC